MNQKKKNLISLSLSLSPFFPPSLETGFHCVCNFGWPGTLCITSSNLTVICLSFPCARITGVWQAWCQTSKAEF